MLVTHELEAAVDLNPPGMGHDGEGGGAKLYCVVVGLGGVGSWVARLLGQRPSPVGRLKIIDFDQITLSSLNRHACATHDDVGLPKAVVLCEYLKRENPGLRVDVEVAMFEEANAYAMLLGGIGDGDRGRPDYVFDCIDHAETKALLMSMCSELGLPVCSVMGTGARLDPGQLFYGLLDELPPNDPLYKKMRFMVGKHQKKRRHQQKQKGADSGGPIHVVTSVSLPDVGLMPLNDCIPSAEQAAEFAVLPSFRVRIMPVFSPVPCMAAAVAVSATIGGCHSLPARLLDCQASQIHSRLMNRWSMALKEEKEEEKEEGEEEEDDDEDEAKDLPGKGTDPRPFLSEHDVRWLVEDYFGMRSALSNQFASVLQLVRVADLLRFSPDRAAMDSLGKVYAVPLGISHGATDPITLLTGSEARKHFEVPYRKHLDRVRARSRSRKQKAIK